MVEGDVFPQPVVRRGVSMSEVMDNLPVVYGIHAPSGDLRHVDSVSNGKACDCLCPDPHCGQRLIAKNRGKKKIHHFAHERGSCSWSVEYVIALLARESIRSRGLVAFPALTYHDEETQTEVMHAKAGWVPIAEAELRTVSGRQAPDLFVTWRSAQGEEKPYAIVFQLIHAVTTEQLSRLASAAEGVILVDLRKDMQREKKAQGKHFDRESIVLKYQDAGFIAWLLDDPNGDVKSWVHSAVADRLWAESAARAKQAREKEKRRQEAERASLREERAKAEENRRKEREAREAEAARARELFEKREAEEERRLEEERMREEAMQPHNDYKFLPKMRELVEQQDVPATDEFGRRWARCQICGKVAPEREFSVYGGAAKLNIGTCVECMRKAQ